MALVAAIKAGDDARAKAIHARMSEHSKRISKLREYGRSTTRVGLQLRGLPIKEYPRWPTKDIPADDRALMDSSIKQLLEEIAAVPA